MSGSNGVPMLQQISWRGCVLFNAMAKHQHKINISPYEENKTLKLQYFEIPIMKRLYKELNVKVGYFIRIMKITVCAQITLATDFPTFHFPFLFLLYPLFNWSILFLFISLHVTMRLKTVFSLWITLLVWLYSSLLSLGLWGMTCGTFDMLRNDVIKCKTATVTGQFAFFKRYVGQGLVCGDVLWVIEMACFLERVKYKSARAAKNY